MLSESWTLAQPRDLRSLVDLSVVIERAGAHGVLVGEHVVMGPDAGRNGAPANPRDFFRNGNQRPADAHPSSLELLSAMAAVTNHLVLHAVALLSPLRHPLVLGKQLATLDLISQGRLVFMPSTSWQREEYAALAVDFDKRGDILDEQLEVWRGAWRDDVLSHRGTHYEFRDVYFEPKPWRPDGPLLWIGGSRLHRRAIRRAVRYADGVFPGKVPTDEELDLLSWALTQEGRRLEDVDLCMWLGAETPFPDDRGPKPLGPALDAAAPHFGRGIATFVMKASQYIDHVDQLGDLVAEAQTGLRERLR
ncbi:LLM class flavin-dependent oxidoreductase [Streptomyces sp. NBC_00582]|uniref:LLM class flavin-dependent oxidoreductase n=1 Tax=Streptomyces sp. NBC_00582 TaxID=2975783 RepID=UPI002E8116EB|nr:LLM class flavin-dependent oxidoreductase [Streptomyces sp. NBC_00582]WUB67453.1 LLM class flavin-dependent oxidoreductase [Streptomyces sp. NBC_00582]